MEDESNNTILDIKVDLSSYDLLELGEKLAELDAEQDLIQSEKKLAMAEWNSKVSINANQMKTLLRQYRDKYRVDAIECAWSLDIINGMTQYHSLETGEMVFQREMTPEERQLDLFKHGTKEEDLPFAGKTATPAT